MRYLLFMIVFCPFAAVQGQEKDLWTKESVEVLLTSASAIDSLVDQAIRHSYSLNAAQAEALQQYENVRQEKNRWLSTFRIGITFFSMNTSVSALDQSVTRVGVLPNVGFNLMLDPEKFINRGSYIREAEYNVTRAESSVVQLRRMLRAEMTALFYQYLEAIGSVELRELSVQQQQEQCLLLEEKFRRGEGRLEDLLNNQSALVQAREGLMKSQLSVRKLHADIQLLVGDAEQYFTGHPLLITQKP